MTKHTRTVGCAAALVVLAGSVGMVAGQEPDSGPVAYVTWLTGRVVRSESGETLAVTSERWSDQQARTVSSGEAIMTADDGSATLILPENGIVLHVEPASKFQFSLRRAPSPDVVPAVLELKRGGISVVRRSAEGRWFLVVGVVPGREAYLLSQNATFTAIIDAREGVVFDVSHGDALCFDGLPPDGPLLGESGQPEAPITAMVPAGHRWASALLHEGTRESVGLGGPPMERLMSDAYALALEQSDLWVVAAEQGDFTPVRPSSRAGVRLESTMAMLERAFVDQPTVVNVSPALAMGVGAGRITEISPAQRLLGSDDPGALLFGQRLRQTRFSGRLGTIGGSVAANPSSFLVFTVGQ